MNNYVLFTLSYHIINSVQTNDIWYLTFRIWISFNKILFHFKIAFIFNETCNMWLRKKKTEWLFALSRSYSHHPWRALFFLYSRAFITKTCVVNNKFPRVRNSLSRDFAQSNSHFGTLCEGEFLVFPRSPKAVARSPDESSHGTFASFLQLVNLFPVDR